MTESLTASQHTRQLAQSIKLPNGKSLVFVGLMGVGKSSVGRRVAHMLDMDFKDADTEIEVAAGRTVPEIFRDFGEEAFRDGERKVIARVLREGQLVLATGGGAFMDPQTRIAIQEQSVSVWLNAHIDVLVERVSNNDSRPLLAEGNAREKLIALAEQRNPVYALADIQLQTDGFSLNDSCDAVLTALKAYLSKPYMKDKNA